MSDVFGSLVKQYHLQQTTAKADWLIGAGTLLPTLGKALRSMKKPGSAYSGDRQPGHMDQYVDLPDDGDPKNDSGGVHINSGIPNRVFYVVATELGDTLVAARIWYHALNFLKPNSTFAQAAAQTADSARVLVKAGVVHKGATQVVRGAWRQVGVG
jgi:Zn-dependent metalloprotease